MNNEPQLTIFEPSKEPRTVTLRITEDKDSDLVTIYDENGCKVTDYKILYDESQSVDTDKEKIIAYIKDWESQGNSVNEKQARKIEKRKRVQVKKKIRKERNKKRKMKSLIHCNLGNSPLANAKDVEEERALLRAMKTQKHMPKNVFNIKPNRIINCNTNVRPYENSTIEIGTKKKPIDVVVLDSDEEVVSDSDDIQINIDTPQLIPRANRRTTNFSDDCSFRNRNSFVTSNTSTRRRQNRPVETVQIVDSSDSDVECVSCEEFIESLSDDDGDDGNNNSTACKKTRSGNTNVENRLAPNSEELLRVPEDENANDELVSLVDSFVSKYIQTALPPLTEISCQTDPEFSASQILITEPVSLQPKSPPPSTIKSPKNQIIAPQLVITGSISLQSGSPRSSAVELPKNQKAAPALTIPKSVSLQSSPSTRNRSKQSQKQVTFNSTVDEKATNDDELVIIENEPPDKETLIRDLVDEPVRSDSSVEHGESVEMSEDSKDVEISSKQDDNQHHPNMIEFDSIPSPDYTPFESIPATASNLKAFAEFIRSREIPDSSEDDVSDDELPVALEESTPVTTVKSAPKSNTKSSTPPAQRSSESNKQSCHPWRKRSHDQSDKVQVCNQSTQLSEKRDRDKLDETPDVVQTAIKRDRSPRPWEKCRQDKSEEIQVLEHFPANRNRSSRPWEKRSYGEFKESQAVERSSNPEIRCQSSCCPNKSILETTRQSEKPTQVNFDNQQYRRNAFSHQRYQRRPYQRNAPPPRDSAVEFFDKHSIRIGESQNELEKTCCQEKSLKPESVIEPADGSYRKFYPKRWRSDGIGRDRESNEPYQGQDDSQDRPYYRNIHSIKVWDVEPWNCKSNSETGVTVEKDTSKELWHERSEPQQSQKCSESTLRDDYCNRNASFKRGRNRYAPEPCEEKKFVPKRNRYHPEPYEEDKFVPLSEPPPPPPPSFSNRKVPWRNAQTNRGGHFCRNDQYHNRQTEYNKNNYSRGDRFQSKFPPNQGQRYNRCPSNQRYPQRSIQNTPTYSRRTTEERAYPPNDRYGNQSQAPSSSSYQNITSSQKPRQEELFTRRPDKFEYKANVGDFDDFNDQYEQPSGQPSYYQVENYELDVAKTLLNENVFSWENKVACDFVAVKPTESVASSPPWHSDSSNSNYNQRINAISRRGWINDTINMRN